MPEVSQKARLAVRERPEEAPIMHQDWKDLLFLHWKYDPGEIQKTLPPGLFVDTFEGHGYLSVSPFFMENLSLANMPSIPGLSSFIEVNVRTYVYDKNGTPGIWFYSLDINSLVASNAARKAFSLPYFYADLKKLKTDIGIEGKRIDEPHASMKFIYQPAEESSHFADAGTLEFFLIERYALFSFESNQLSMGRVNHKPYPMIKVNVVEWNTDLLEVNSFNLSDKQPDATHYSSEVSVDIYHLKSVH